MNFSNLKLRFLFMPVIILASFLIIIGATQALTTTNNPPNLSFPTFGPYTGDGIDPNTGTANETLFSFKIIYTDTDNDPPTNLRVVVFYGGTATSTGLFMSPDTDEFINPELRDGNYQNGEQYVVSSTFQKGNYSYIFETNDMKSGGQPVFFPTTTTLTFTVSESVIPPPPPPPPFDFSLSTGGSKTITQGQSITNTITATLTSGSAQPMSFSVVSSPVLTGGTIGFSPISCTPTCVSTATITTITSTPAGTYTITVTGTGGGVTHTTSFALTVNAVPPTSPPPKKILIAIDPGHGQYFNKNGVLTFQRDPTPIYGLIEDRLVLDISKNTKEFLRDLPVPPYLLRKDDLILLPQSCKNGPPCYEDIKERVEEAKRKNAKLLISIHTNGGFVKGDNSCSTDACRRQNGTEVYYCGQSSLNSKVEQSRKLANYIFDKQGQLGLTKRKVLDTCYNILQTKTIPAALTEVAFHSNTVLALNQSITDETRLSDSNFLSQIGAAIAEAVRLYLGNN